MKIVGTGSCLPQRVVSNDDLAAIMDTSDEWISSRTGIRNRHIATTETTTSLACDAVKSALQDAGIDGSEIDLIIAASVSTDKIVPSLACQIQAEIGAGSAVAFDINAACSGFLFGLATADAYFKTGRFHKAVVVGAEVLSKIMDWNDRSTCVLFGDGAGAAVVTDEGDAFKGFVQGSDGKGGEALDGDNRPVVNPFTDNGKQSALGGYVTMDGPAVYKFAVKTVPKAINELLDESAGAQMMLMSMCCIRPISVLLSRLLRGLSSLWTNFQPIYSSVEIFLRQVCRFCLIKSAKMV
jgi:3-oxoacyl-[acyl-carrier-protein] synthase-3